jgi:hypothetical protein
MGLLPPAEDLPDDPERLKAHIRADHEAMDRAITIHGEMSDLLRAAAVKVDAVTETSRRWHDHATQDCEGLRRCWVLMRRWEAGMAGEAAMELRAAITGEGWWE